MTDLSKPAPQVEAPQIPNGPLLTQLAGMDRARRWGEGLVKDIALYRSGSLDWSEIDAGCVLHGPPGTGKTTFARALAASAHLPLIATSYADWNRNTRYVGDIIDVMRSIFLLAEAHAPCVVAIDELDSLPARETLSPEHPGTHMIVNALLEQLDGLNKRKGVIVIGTCNDPGRLDSALVRPGRLGTSIRIGLPDVAALPKILSFHLKGDAARLGNLADIAVMCVGHSGAAVEQLVREARQIARRAGRPVGKSDLVSILEGRVASLSRDDIRRVSIHESGHGIAAHKILKVTAISLSIIPTDDGIGRMVALAPTSSLTRESLMRRMIVLLAGRAAEDVILGAVSGGAGGDARSDLGRASETALSAIALQGLSRTGQAFWHGPHRHLPAPPIPQSIYAEAALTVDEAYAAARSLIADNRTLVTTVADALEASRALSHEAFLRLVSQPRYPAFEYSQPWGLPDLPPRQGPPYVQPFGPMELGRYARKR